MYKVVLLSGSPAQQSKSNQILQRLSHQLTNLGFQTHLVSVKDFAPETLLYAKISDPSIQDFITHLQSADAFIVATPIYKGTYTGALKTVLDILPQYALRHKTVLPIATGGSVAHLLAMDYSIKPVLSILGSSDILQGVFISDNQFYVLPAGNFKLDDDIQTRLNESVHHLVKAIKNKVSKEQLLEN
ncbi:NADPH-dependent FMN reductase [Pedobacter sp. AW1-32]|uniref:NADPH-dependent FMN reductase n=1 Tax=Pedobacter sp. AW1-32 TaxID=3383026 RepID=UPI003FF0CB6B